MMTLFASRSSSAVSAAVMGVTSPTGGAPLAAAVVAPPSVPKPPAITEMNRRFMARHMM